MTKRPGTTTKGYIRVWKRNSDYGKYEHRVVEARLAREHCYYPVNESGLPDGFHVHHMDFKKDHNCHCNLLLIQDVIHDACSSTMQRRCPYTGRFLGQWEWEQIMGKRADPPPPDWVTSKEYIEEYAASETDIRELQGVHGQTAGRIYRPDGHISTV